MKPVSLSNCSCFVWQAAKGKSYVLRCTLGNMETSLTFLPVLNLLRPVGPVRAQAVSRRLPTVAARVRAKFRSCGICGWQSETGAGFLQDTSASLANSHSTGCSTLIVIRGGYKGPVIDIAEQKPSIASEVFGNVFFILFFGIYSQAVLSTNAFKSLLHWINLLCGICSSLIISYFFYCPRKTHFR
jgi:hypothetical protein